jgi:HSP20 family protein
MNTHTETNAPPALADQAITAETVTPDSAEASAGVKVGAALRTVRTFRPTVDVLEGDAGFRLVVDLPGVSAEHLTVGFDSGNITVSGRRPLGRQARDGSQLAVAYERGFELPDSVDASQITAELSHGVLTLDLPRSDASKPRQIPVTIS